MKVRPTVRAELPKLCHARPGELVRLPGDDGRPSGPLYLVCAAEVKGRRALRECMTHGLYDDERPLFLVDIETGAATPMPHLSSRAQIIDDAEVVV